MIPNKLLLSSFITFQKKRNTKLSSDYCIVNQTVNILKILLKVIQNIIFMFKFS